MNENYQKLKAEIENHKNPDYSEGCPAAFMYEDIDETVFENLPNGELFKGMKAIDHYGGEDQGSDYYTIWHFPAADVYIKFEGWYQSYNGAEFERMFQVEPKKVEVIQYLAVK